MVPPTPMIDHPAFGDARAQGVARIRHVGGRRLTGRGRRAEREPPPEAGARCATAGAPAGDDAADRDRRSHPCARSRSSIPGTASCSAERAFADRADRRRAWRRPRRCWRPSSRPNNCNPALQPTSCRRCPRDSGRASSCRAPANGRPDIFCRPDGPPPRRRRRPPPYSRLGRRRRLCNGLRRRRSRRHDVAVHGSGCRRLWLTAPLRLGLARRRLQEPADAPLRPAGHLGSVLRSARGFATRFWTVARSARCLGRGSGGVDGPQARYSPATMAQTAIATTYQSRSFLTIAAGIAGLPLSSFWRGQVRRHRYRYEVW